MNYRWALTYRMVTIWWLCVCHALNPYLISVLSFVSLVSLFYRSVSTVWWVESWGCGSSDLKFIKSINHLLLRELYFLKSCYLALVFWKSIRLEVASDSYCFLINSSWLLVFILYVFFMIFSGFNLFCWSFF